MFINGIQNNYIKSSDQLVIELIASSAEKTAELRQKAKESYIRRKMLQIMAQKVDKQRNETDTSENKRIDKLA
ncbi:MAG: hypothetical protein GXO87_10840 [Chlorobi bacterium]|nr:hypothetical protein [Chlorobiota bacterium]